LELKEQTETDRLPRVKEKRNYKRFELIPFLAILGCAGMLLFECIFIFELYDRAVEQPERPFSVVKTPAAASVSNAVPALSAPVEVLAAPVISVETNAPVSTNSAPIALPVKPAVVPVG